MAPRIPGRRMAGLAARQAQRALADPARWMVLSGLDAALAAADAAVTSSLARDAVGRVDLDRLVERVLDSPMLDPAVARVIDSRLLEGAVTRVLDGPLFDVVVARLLQSDGLWVLIDEIARSPAVTAAISQQGVGFANQVAGVARERSRNADDRLERLAARLTRRVARGASGPRPEPAPGP